MKNKQPQFTEPERNRMVTAFMFKLMEADMSHVVTDDIWANIHRFIKSGTTYATNLDLPEYGSILEIRLSNNKRDENSMNFQLMKMSNC